MMYYIRVDENDVVVGSGVCQDEVSGMIECGDNERVEFNVPLMSSSERHLFVNGELVNTGQPKRPPAPWMVWDTQARLWVDGRTEAQKTAEAWAGIRARRNELLAACDWTQLPDVSSANRAAWAEYRQALRDVTAQPDPENVVWPVPPAET